MLLACAPNTAKAPNAACNSAVKGVIDYKGRPLLALCHKALNCTSCYDSLVASMVKQGISFLYVVAFTYRLSTICYSMVYNVNPSLTLYVVPISCMKLHACSSSGVHSIAYFVGIGA